MQPSLHAFLDELTKLAAPFDAARLEMLRKRLKPGDIILANYRNPTAVDKVVSKVVSVFQGGTPFTHSALYAGDGKVIDSHPKDSANPQAAVSMRSLEDFAKGYTLKALQVKAPKKIRDEAVAYAEQQIGKGYDMIGALRQGLPARKDFGARARQKAVDSFFCSQLISNAYADFPMGKSRFVGDVRPVDFEKSPKTRTIGVVP
jgi:cell wall-associated NlpC family hydrolase